MARRHLSNPREGEDRGHGRDRSEVRALRQRVRDLEAEVAAYQQIDTEPFETAMAKVHAGIAAMEGQNSRLLNQRRALAEGQEILNERLPQILQGIRDPGSSRPTLRMRLAALLAHIDAWLRRRAPGGNR